jgi:autotransporter-associated beta strand protein
MAILRRRSNSRRKNSAPVAASRRRLFFETLEDRRVLNGAYATVYVDDSFTGNSGDLIADADLGTTGNQPATFGVNAFNTIAQALTAVTSSGTVIVNDGTYAEAVALAGTQTLRITGADAAQTVVISSLATGTGQVVNIVGSSNLTIGDGTNTAIAGTITGSGSLTKQGTGTVTLSSGSSTYTGATTIDGGVLRLTHVNATGTTSGVTVNDTGPCWSWYGCLRHVFYAGRSDLNTARRSAAWVTEYSSPATPVIASGATVNFATVKPAISPHSTNRQRLPERRRLVGHADDQYHRPRNRRAELRQQRFPRALEFDEGTLRVITENAFGNPTVSGALAGSTLTFSGGNLLIRSDSALSFNAGSDDKHPGDGGGRRGDHECSGSRRQGSEGT